MPTILIVSAIVGLAAAVARNAAADEPAGPQGLLTWERLADLPDPEGVAGGFAGVVGSGPDERLVVAGGANFPDRPPWDGGAKAWHDSAWSLADPAGTWRAEPPLPRPLAYGVAASFGGRVWCVGGGDERRHVATSVAIALASDAKRLVYERDPLPPMPKPVAFAAGVLVGSRLYVAGGQESPEAKGALATLWSIDLAEPARATWKEHPAWPGPPRILPVLATNGGMIYLVSGAELVAAETAASGSPAVTRRFLADAYRFDPKRETWSVLAPPPAAMVAAAGPAIPLDATRLVFLPGDDGSLFERRNELAGRHPGFPRAIHCYDTVADAWRPAGAIPAAVGGVATSTPVTTPTVAWRGRTVIPSGEIRPGRRTPVVLACRPAATQGPSAAIGEPAPNR